MMTPDDPGSATRPPYSEAGPVQGSTLGVSGKPESPSPRLFVSQVPPGRKREAYELTWQPWTPIAIIAMLLILFSPELFAQRGAGAAAWDRFPYYPATGILQIVLLVPSLLVPQVYLYAAWMLLSLLLIGFHCSRPHWGTYILVHLNGWILAAGYWVKAMYMREEIHHFGPMQLYEGEAAFLAYIAAVLATVHVILLALPVRKVLRPNPSKLNGFPTLDEFD